MTPWREMAVAVALGLAAASARAQGADPPPPSVSELARLVAEQGRMLEEQKREIERLRKQLEETQQLSLAAHNRLEEMAKAAPAPTVSAAVEERLAKIEESVQRIPDLPSDVVSAGDFPGSMRVPGTDVAMKVAGLVRVTAVDTFGPLGTEDRFVTSSIPVAGSPEAGKEPRFVLTPIPSRVNLDVRTPTGVGAMRAFVEGDFAGSSKAFRLRHAYGQWKSLLVGQTWSTFADPEAEPDGIDFEGLNAIALFRQPLVRWTKPLGERYSLAAAIENPAPDITNAKGVSQVPDIVVRARWRPSEGRSKGPFGLMNVFRQDAHVNVALLFRQIRGEPLDQPNTTLSTTGFGVGRERPADRPVAGGQGPGHLLGLRRQRHRPLHHRPRDARRAGRLLRPRDEHDRRAARLRLVPRVREALGRELRSTFTYGSVLVDNIERPARLVAPHDEPRLAQPHLVPDPAPRHRRRVPVRQPHRQGRREGRLEPAPARHELQVLRRR